jgi:hypothetical protein
MVTVGTKPYRPRICRLGPMPRPGEFSGSTRTSWNLTRHTPSSSPANPQPASPETEGCYSRFSKIWQSRHTLPMVRANKMQSNLCNNRRHAPCPTSKHAAKWARQRKSQTGFAAGAFWRLMPAGTSGNLVLASHAVHMLRPAKDHGVTTRPVSERRRQNIGRRSFAKPRRRLLKQEMAEVSSDTHVRPALQCQGCRTTTKSRVSSRSLKAGG